MFFVFFSYGSITSLTSETLPLLCVTFITENSLVAAVSTTTLLMHLVIMEDP